jgi:hypothetical protein
MTQQQRDRLEQNIYRYTPRIVGGLCVVVILLVGAAVYLSFQYQATNREVDETQQQQVLGLRENQYINCVRSANALRRQVRREFIGLKRDILIPVFSQVAHTIPKGAPSRRILTGTVVYMHKRIRTIENRIPNVDCAKRYPPLPGQSFDQVRPDRTGGGDGRSTNLRPSSQPAPDQGAAGGPESPSAGGSSGVGGSDGGGNTQPPPSPPSPPSPPTNPPPQPPQSPPNPPPAPAPSGPLDGVTAPLEDTLDGVTDGAHETVCNLPVRLCP